MVANNKETNEKCDKLYGKSISDKLENLRINENIDLNTVDHELDKILDLLKNQSNLNSFEIVSHSLMSIIRTNSFHLHTNLKMYEIIDKVLTIFCKTECVGIRTKLVDCLSLLVDYSINTDEDWFWGIQVFFKCLVGSPKKYGKETATKLFQDTSCLMEEFRNSKQIEMLNYAVNKICDKFYLYQRFLPYICERFESILYIIRPEGNIGLAYELCCIILRLAKKPVEINFMTKVFANLFQLINEHSQFLLNSMVSTIDVLLSIIECEQTQVIFRNHSIHFLATLSGAHCFNSVLISHFPRIVNAFIRLKYLETIKPNWLRFESQLNIKSDWKSMIEISFTKIVCALYNDTNYIIIENEIENIVSQNNSHVCTGIFIVFAAMAKSQTQKTREYLPKIMEYFIRCLEKDDVCLAYEFINTICMLIEIYKEELFNNFHKRIFIQINQLSRIFFTFATLNHRFVIYLNLLIETMKEHILRIYFSEILSIITNTLIYQQYYVYPNRFQVSKILLQSLNNLLKVQPVLLSEYIDKVVISLIEIVKLFQYFPYIDFYIEWFQNVRTCCVYTFFPYESHTNEFLPIILSIDWKHSTNSEYSILEYYEFMYFTVRFLLNSFELHTAVVTDYIIKALVALLDIYRRNEKDNTWNSVSFKDLQNSIQLWFEFIKIKMHIYTCKYEKYVDTIFDLTIDSYQDIFDEDSLCAIHEIWKITLSYEFKKNIKNAFSKFKRICGCISSCVPQTNMMATVFPCIFAISNYFEKDDSKLPPQDTLSTIVDFNIFALGYLSLPSFLQANPKIPLGPFADYNATGNAYFCFIRALANLNRSLFKKLKYDYIPYFNIYSEIAGNLFNSSIGIFRSQAFDFFLPIIYNTPGESMENIEILRPMLMEIFTNKERCYFTKVSLIIDEIMKNAPNDHQDIVNQSLIYFNHVFDDIKIDPNDREYDLIFARMDIISTLTDCPTFVSSLRPIIRKWTCMLLNSAFLFRTEDDIRNVIFFLSCVPQSDFNIFSEINTDDIYKAFDAIAMQLIKSEDLLLSSCFVTFLQDFKVNCPNIYPNWQGKSNIDWKRIKNRSKVPINKSLMLYC